MTSASDPDHPAAELRASPRAGGLAHEVTSSMSVIMNYTQLALEEAESQPELRSDLEEIARAAQRASELTRELLSLSRQEPFETEVVDLNDVIRDSETMLRRTIGDQVTLLSDLSDELWATTAGAGELEQILVQLARNARAAMPDGGVLAIYTENLTFEDRAGDDEPELPPGRFVRLTVADTGSGMSEEVAAHALVTVRGAVRRLGGFVRQDSEPDGSAASRVYLPAVDPVDPAVEGSAAAVEDGRGEKILLVEERDAIRRLTRRILAEHGYEVIPTDGVSAALAAWRERAPGIDLLLTDVTMHGMSGAALAERLRSEWPGLALLFTSDDAGDIAAHEGPQQGAAVVEEPFSSDGLLRSVRRALGEPV